MGSDDGFDARGWENVPGPIVEADDLEELLEKPSGDRIWLIQCKREKSIGPSKLIGYLNDIAETDRDALYGVILAAPCDFSKKARDQFRNWCAEHGISECYLWGKAELEDALFQPKNDNLLFAYFGLSLTIRKRSTQTRLRAQTTIKRKLTRALENKSEILIRDVEDLDYPYTQTAAGEDTSSFRWWVYQNPTLTFRGLEVIGRRHFAFLDEDMKHWDYANAQNDAGLRSYADPWRGDNSYDDTRQELFDFWNSLPEVNRGWMYCYGIISFGDIFEVDDIGDDITRHSHIYVQTSPRNSHPFSSGRVGLERIYQQGQLAIDPISEFRVEKFPAKFRKAMPTPEDFRADF